MHYTQIQAQTTMSGMPDGWGVRSSVLTDTTLDGLPSGPQELAMTSRSDICITVQWMAPASPNGLIVSYTVNMHY